jgi:UDP-N-acetylmuramate dehydrogenase
VSAAPPPGDLHTVIRGSVSRNEPLSRHTTLRIGGPADWFVQPLDEADLSETFQWADRRGLAAYCLGLGSNLLVPDEGVRGVVTTLGPACVWVRFDGPRVAVGAGYPVMRLLNEAAERGLTGLEGVSGVPGTVGGALAMNAGTPAGDMGQVTRSVRVLLPGGRIATWSREDLGFGYRRSRLQQERAVALEALLELRPGDPAAIRQAIADNAVRRRQTQPIELPNAGSVWTNPAGDHAGRLVEAAGCKGWRVGDAQVSPKHANFIVNLGRARAADVITLMARVRRAVAERFGVRLEPELRWLHGQRELEALLTRAEADLPGG